jgi:tetratricopeptide (TPR) repeat protein
MNAALRQAISFSVALLSVAAPSAVFPQILPGEVERDHVKSEVRLYHDLILDYRRGSGGVVERLLAWDTRRLSRVLSAIDGRDDDTRPWDPIRFKAAAMVHTDAALQLVERADLDTALSHLDVAGQLLEKGDSGLRPYAARWTQAAARLLQERKSSPLAERFLERARMRLPNDPTVLYESGMLHERMAGDSVLPTVVYAPELGVGRTPTPTREDRSNRQITRDDVDNLKRRRIENLNQAAIFFRQSLAADDSNMLARLHLGRVESLGQRHDDALALLQQAAAAEDPATSYLGFLFIAALHERQGALGAAADSYRAAIDRFPRGHAAYTGLSALLQRSGRTDESREVLGRVVDGAVASRREPWWSYLAEHRSLNIDRFDRLRKEARQ